MSAAQIRLYWVLWSLRSLGVADLEQLQDASGVSRRRIVGTLDSLESAGLVKARVALGIVRYSLTRVARIVEMTPARLRDLVLSTASGIRTAVAVLAHTPAKRSLAWPGNRRMGEMIGRSSRTVQRGLRALKDAGAVLNTRCPWWKLPGFRPAYAMKRKRVRVLAWLWDHAPKLSRNPAEVCRAVIDQTVKDLIRMGGKPVVVIEDPILTKHRPASLGGGGAATVRTFVERLGLSEAQMGWIATRYEPNMLHRCIKRLRPLLPKIKRPDLYLLKVLAREAACCSNVKP